ncbi:MAG: ParB/RepB/Spo0J family partition protein [Pseudomonadota bacterium]
MTNQSKIGAESAIVYASLNQLFLHDLNPRQEVAQEDVETLADSIRTCGLLQNLSGIKDDSGKIGIVAGGRRLRALAYLAEADPKQETVTSIPVLLTDDIVQAEMWANAENTAREDLDPADEIRAYGRMAKSNATADAIASAFGVTVAHVTGRLKLAGLPDAALDALKAKKINLTSAQKMTTAHDEKLIVEAVQLIEDGQISNINQLDRALHPKAAKATDRRAAFVGAEVYEAAGGKISRDLFSEDVFFEDQAVLDEAFAARMAEKAEAIRDDMGLAWVETHDESYLHYHFLQERKFERVYPVEGILTEEESDEFDGLAELAEGDVLTEEGQARLDVLQAVLDGEYSDDQKQFAGAVVYVDSRGKLDVEHGLVRSEDKKAAIEAGVLSKPQHTTSPVTKSPISQKLASDLERIACGARQSAALRDPDLILALFAFQLSGKSGYTRPFGLRQDEVPNLPTTEFAGYSMDDRLTTPTKPAKFGSDAARVFRAYKAKGPEFIMEEIIRHLAALMTLDSTMAEVVDKAVDTNIRDNFTPNAENFFGRVGGPYMVAQWQELLGLEADHPTVTTFSKLKKAEKAGKMESLIADQETRDAHGLDDAACTRIADWLPEGMK